ncbi:helix-turn-helix domain-containing protein [Caenimonas sedimenti]|uniref:Helix-turn-helix domain-containing protein n=1 Tax=Caenimonas sedimenti TaxID=2596921 RepID=A0A562ZLP0_9BURK|nr:helix-turn-helix domain-containing protein [Caenimonas sedimenti]TWO69492.1 helix-turn-helix domain-containing protein [Caenimonas sedimenti]
MANRTSSLLPATERRLRELGERLRLARLRRKLTAAHLAERAGMAPMTLRGIERGTPGATLGAYAAVMQVLGLDADIDLLGAQDPLGRELQDSRLGQRATPAAAARVKHPAAELHHPPGARAAPARRRSAPPEGHASEDLARLVAPKPVRGKGR